MNESLIKNYLKGAKNYKISAFKAENTMLEFYDQTEQKFPKLKTEKYTIKIAGDEGLKQRFSTGIWRKNRDKSRPCSAVGRAPQLVLCCDFAAKYFLFRHSTRNKMIQKCTIYKEQINVNKLQKEWQDYPKIIESCAVIFAAKYFLFRHSTRNKMIQKYTIYKQPINVNKLQKKW